MTSELNIDRRKLLELGKIRSQNILDIGAGKLASIAAGDFDCIVTSIDVSESIIEEERKRVKKEGLAKRITLEEEDAADLSYPDNHFDSVISYGALHHNPIDKREIFIEEASRVAKKKIVIAEFKKEHHIHPEDVHPSVDHDWLKNTLKEYGKVTTYEGKEKILYVCELNK